MAMQQRTAVISAAASGIGRVLAEGLLADGWRLFICDADPVALADFATAHPSTLASRVDVADPAAVAGFAETVRAALGPDGRLDLLVNNAGVAGPVARLEEQPVDGWQRCIDVNLNGTFYLTRALIPLLRAHGPGAAVVNMSSNAGLMGCPLRAPYVASKWALIGLTKTLAMELGPAGIRVNALCPGSVEGPRIDRVIAADAASRGLADAEVRREYQRQSSLRSFARAEDILAMVRFLASDAGARISGQALAIDGHTETLSMELED